MSFASPFSWRVLRPNLQTPGKREMLRLCELFEPAPYALGLDEPILGRIQRRLRPTVLDGHLARLENLLENFTTKTQRTQRIGNSQITQIRG